MPIPHIDTGKNIAMTVEPWSVVTLRDAEGRDIANILITDKHPRRSRMVFQVSEAINVRREMKGNTNEED